MSFTFGTPQTTTASTGFAFGASNTQATPAQSATPFGFGTPAAATTSIPTLGAAPAIAATANTTAGLTFGTNAPPYGAQTTAASSFNFGLGATTTR